MVIAGLFQFTWSQLSLGGLVSSLCCLGVHCCFESPASVKSYQFIHLAPSASPEKEGGCHTSESVLWATPETVSGAFGGWTAQSRPHRALRHTHRLSYSSATPLDLRAGSSLCKTGTVGQHCGIQIVFNKFLEFRLYTRKWFKRWSFTFIFRCCIFAFWYYRVFLSLLSKMVLWIYLKKI